MNWAVLDTTLYCTSGGAIIRSNSSPGRLQFVKKRRWGAEIPHAATGTLGDPYEAGSMKVFSS